MSNDDLDRALRGEDQIAPSPGFVANVMDAVRREASAPPPIPFPWTRALPAFAAGAVALVGFVIVLLAHTGRRASAEASPITGLVYKVFEVARAAGVEWILVAFLISFCSITLARNIGRARV